MDIRLKIKIQTETNCFECFHYKVCSKNMSERCKNFERINYLSNDCLNCLHHINKLRKCFYCEDFVNKEVQTWSRINGL